MEKVHPIPKPGDPGDETLRCGGEEIPSRYRAHLLARATPTERGIVYLRGEKSYLLAWERVRRVFAGCVGEPSGVRTVVFDLAVLVHGPECVAFRLAADPGACARTLARAIHLGVAGEARGKALVEVAEEGETHRLHADLDVFEAAALEAIRFG